MLHIGGFFFMIRPVGDRVVIEPIEKDETTASGIVIPDSAKEKPQEGMIVAVGNRRNEKGEKEELDVKVGDRVIFAKYAGTELKHEDKEYLIMRESDILAIMD